MTLSSDNQRGNDDLKVGRAIHPQYEMLGHFRPRDAARILEQLEEQHLPFEVEDYDQIGFFANWPWRRIYVRGKDKKEAEAISDQNSARSRAATGIRYVAVGGIIGMVALLQMRSGILSIPYRYGRPMPLEFVAGIAGIVAFMGFLQLVIAIILKLRGRQ